ncbi:MAG: hypothetical protein WCG27_09965, partial [Pseudomonadota bacterium]
MMAIFSQAMAKSTNLLEEDRPFQNRETCTQMIRHFMSGYRSLRPLNTHLRQEQGLQVRAALNNNRPNALVALLKTFNFQRRFIQLRLMGWWAGESLAFVKNWAAVVNLALSEKVITPTQVEEMVLAMKKRGNRLLSLGLDGSVLVRDPSFPAIRAQVNDLLMELLARGDFSPAWQAEYRQLIYQLEILPEDLENIVSALPRRLDEDQMHKVISYLQYAYSLRLKERAQALEDVAEIFLARPSSKWARHFKTWDSKFEAYQEKIRQENYGQYLAQGRSDASLLAEEESWKARQTYEKLVYGCRAYRMNKEHSAAGKTFRRFYIMTGLISSTTLYSWANWDKPKNGEWAGRLTFDLLIGTVMRWVIGFIRSNPLDPFVTKFGKNYLLSAISDLGLSSLYGLFFNEKKPTTEEQVEIKKLEDSLKMPQWDEKWQKELGTALDENINESVQAEVDYRELTLQKVAQNIQQSGNSAWITSGNRG